MDDEQQYLWELRHEVLYASQLSERYHRRRERFFDTMDRLTKATAVFGGAGAVANVTPASVIPWLALLVTAAGTVGLVFGLAERARRHAELARGYKGIEGDIAETGERDFTEADVNRWTASVRRLEADEPPVLRVLAAMCQDQMAVSKGHSEYYLSSTTWWQRTCAHFFDLWPDRVRSKRPPERAFP